jgi:hypothetical protein
MSFETLEVIVTVAVRTYEEVVLLQGISCTVCCRRRAEEVLGHFLALVVALYTKASG